MKEKISYEIIQIILVAAMTACVFVAAMILMLVDYRYDITFINTGLLILLILLALSNEYAKINKKIILLKHEEQQERE